MNQTAGSICTASGQDLEEFIGECHAIWLSYIDCLYDACGFDPAAFLEEELGLKVLTDEEAAEMADL